MGGEDQVTRNWGGVGASGGWIENDRRQTEKSNSTGPLVTDGLGELLGTDRGRATHPVQDPQTAFPFWSF